METTIKKHIKDLSEQAIAFTKLTTERWTARLAGGTACLECGVFLYKEMEIFCDRSFIQDFKLHPGAFLGFIKIDIVLYLIALAALWLNQTFIAAFLALLAILILVQEFFIYREFIDFLYPSKKGQNVIGVIEPTGEVKQQVVVSGHHDSAHVFNFFVHQPQLYVPRILGGVLSIFLFALFCCFFFVGDLLSWDIAKLENTVRWIFTGLTLLVLQLWFFVGKEGTPGAGDNMIATASAMEVGRYFSQLKKANHGLKHTRLIIASWDAEEEGLRGSRAYVKEFKDQLKAIKTYNFNIECLYDHKELLFLTTDINSLVRLSKPMVKDCIQVAKDLGHQIEKKPFPPLAGGTDAAEFAKEGIDATTLIGMSFKREGDSASYHTLKDTVDKVDPKAVEICIDTCIGYVWSLDF